MGAKMGRALPWCALLLLNPFMKSLLLGLLLLLSNTAISLPRPTRVTFTPLTKSSYIVAKKGCISTKPRTTFPLKKQNGRIVIPTAKGKKVFTDKYINTDRDDQQEFEYSGYLAQFECHVVVGHFYEWSQWFLIDRNGGEITLYDAPEYSPDMQRFVSASRGLEYPVYPNVIRLFRFENHEWHEVWHIEPANWEPYYIGWTSASTLILSKKASNDKMPGGIYTYSRLAIK
jgi:hypothetical protein